MEDNKKQQDQNYRRSARLLNFEKSNCVKISIYNKKFVYREGAIGENIECRWEQFTESEKQVYDKVVKLKDEYNDLLFNENDFGETKKELINLLRQNKFIEFDVRFVEAESFKDEKRRYNDLKYKPFTNVKHPAKRYFQ